jgi:lambda family phage portal protein
MLGRVLDALISAVSPSQGVRRAHARRVLRAYSGAEPSRLNANRRPKNQSADTELGGSFGANAMRAWARMLVRDNAWAWGVVDTFVNSVVGKGIDIQSAYETPDGSDIEVINERRDEVWQRWAEVCEINGQYSFAEIQQMAMREIVEAGEVLIRMVPVDRKFRGILRPVPLALELIEADRLAEEKDTYRLAKPENHRINRGIEFDELGRPVAYWIYPNHPTDPYVDRGEPRRIEASEIIHLFNRQRVGQTRGISMFAPVVSWLRDLGLYVDNELQASAVASCFTVAIKTESAVTGLGPPSSATGTNTTDTDGNRYEYLQPGMVMHLRPNESIESANPGRPNSASEPWIKLMLRGIAVGTGLSYETVARDYSQTNYSSNRASQLEDRRRFRRWQQYLISRLNQRVWDEFCKSAAMVDLAGFPTMTELLANPRKAAPCEHLPPSWEWVDPQAEQTSSEAGIRAFQTTYLDELAGRGKNWRQVFYQRAKEEALLKQLGLVSPTAAVAAEAAATGGAMAAPTATGTGEMMGLSRLQWQRNRKAIMDVLNDFVSGSVSQAQATVLLSGLGLSPDNVTALLDDAADGTVESVPSEEELANAEA